MPRKSYTAAEKERALQLCDSIGIQKASEETGIASKTLYVWRSNHKNKAKAPAKAETLAASPKKAGPGRKKKDPAGQPVPAKQGSEELIRLRMENEALKAQLGSLKNALRAFTE